MTAKDSAKKLLIVGLMEDDALFLQELLVQAHQLGFQADVFFLQDGNTPHRNTRVRFNQKYDVVIASGLASEQWWVDALNKQTAPVVYNDWMPSTGVSPKLDLNVRYEVISGSNVTNILRVAQQLTA